MKSFVVASFCREDLLEYLTPAQINYLDDDDLEAIADRMGDAYRDSGGYWGSMEIMATYILEKKQKGDDERHNR